MTSKIRTIDKFFLAGFGAVVLNCFSYMYLQLPTKTILFSFLIYIFIELRGTYSIRKIASQSLMGAPLLYLVGGYAISTILAFLVWNQPIITASLTTLQYVTVIMLFFFLHAKGVSEASVVKILLLCTIAWTAIEWIQQVTYPQFWFCGRMDEETGYIEERMGLMRFYITGVHVANFILIYYVDKFTQGKKNKIYNFLVWAVALMGIIGFVSRKQIYASILVSLLAFLLVKGKMRILIMCLLIGFSFWGLYELAGMMSELNSQTEEELGSDSFIRTLATNYFLFDFQSSPFYYLFGTGPFCGEASSIGREYLALQERLGFYTVDCGIVGYLAYYGIVNIVLFLAPVIKMLKRWRDLLLWHKLYLLFYGIMINMAFWGNSMLGFSSYIIFLYLVDKHLTGKKRL